MTKVRRLPALTVHDREVLGPPRFSSHALQRMLEFSLDVSAVEVALVAGETIEEYDDGRRLVLGRAGLRPVHVVVREDPAGGVPFVITVYEPHEDRWDASFRQRRRP